MAVVVERVEQKAETKGPRLALMPPMEPPSTNGNTSHPWFRAFVLFYNGMDESDNNRAKYSLGLIDKNATEVGEWMHGIDLEEALSHMRGKSVWLVRTSVEELKANDVA
jgi:hypothetical protein